MKNVVVLAIIIAFPALSLEAQVCKPADASSANMIEAVRQFVTATDPDDMAIRDTLKLPAATAASVVLVTNERSCSSARDAYNAVRAPGAPAATSVYVAQSGSGSSLRYVVMKGRNAGDAQSEFAGVVVLDSKFRYLSAFSL